ncbi:hypothetical protein D3C86_2126590 [compost metagenome]
MFVNSLRFTGTLLPSASIASSIQSFEASGRSTFSITPDVLPDPGRPVHTVIISRYSFP